MRVSKSSIIAAAVLVLALAGAVSGGTFAIVGSTAQASPHPAGRAASSSAKTETFFLSVDDTKEAVVAHGLFTAGGKDVSPANGSADTLYLEGGRLKLSHPDKDSHFTDHVNPTTCYVTFKITGTYTFGHGTGKYKDYSGHGKYTVHEQGILPRTKQVPATIRVPNL